MSTIAITHTRVDGTVLTGVERGDLAAVVLRDTAAAGAVWQKRRDREAWVMIGSRRRPPDHAKIDATAAALRAAGHDVTVTFPTPGPRARPRVGDPSGRIVETEGRTWREPSRQYAPYLGPGQPEQVQEVADQLAMSGGAFIRRAVARLAAGDIPLPQHSSDVPAADTRRTVVLPGDDVAALAAKAKIVHGAYPTVLGARTETGRWHALLRYALAVELAAERRTLGLDQP